MGYNQNYAGMSSVEYISRSSKRITCRDCCHYEKFDKACRVTSIYPPHDRWDSWKYCKRFEQDSNVENYAEKAIVLGRMRGSRTSGYSKEEKLSCGLSDACLIGYANKNVTI